MSVVFSLIFTLATSWFTTGGFRYSDLQVEHEGPMSERGKEVVYFYEDEKGISRRLMKEKRSESGAYPTPNHEPGSLEELFEDAGGESRFMYSIRTEDDPLTGEPPTFYMHSGDYFRTATYEQFRHENNHRVKVDTSILEPIKDISDGEIVIGIASGIRKELRVAMIEALNLLNAFQSTYIFSFIEIPHRHRGYHHIWFRFGASMLKHEVIQTRVPDDEQGMVITYNEFDYSEIFYNPMQVIMIAHEILVGMKYYEGKAYTSSIDDACDANVILEEDSSYLPGMARNFTECHAEVVKGMMRRGKDEAENN